MSVDFSLTTELPGEEASREQIERMCHRYYWAGGYCYGKDVIEVACGGGQGVGYLSTMARTVRAGDYSERNLQIARAYYGERAALIRFDAMAMPFEDRSADVIILFEAIYYIQSVDKFLAECRRVLRKAGTVLIATANKDLYDFNPSPSSQRYYGVVELVELFREHGFDAKCFGTCSFDSVSARQRMLRGAKKFAVRLGLMPRTKRGKQFLKRFVFGKLRETPPEIREGMAPYSEPAPLPGSQPDRRHKVVYCAATLEGE